MQIWKIPFFGECLGIVCFLANRTWKKPLNYIPYRVLYKKDPKLSFMKVFGVKAWVNIPLHNRKKGSKRANECMFTGYQTGMKSFRFVTQNGRICFSRSASFNEQANWGRLHGYETPSQVFLPTTVLRRDWKQKCSAGAGCDKRGGKYSWQRNRKSWSVKTVSWYGAYSGWFKSLRVLTWLYPGSQEELTNVCHQSGLGGGVTHGCYRGNYWVKQKGSVCVKCSKVGIRFGGISHWLGLPVTNRMAQWIDLTHGDLFTSSRWYGVGMQHGKCFLHKAVDCKQEPKIQPEFNKAVL